tara:strand:+ start:328 stop:540 length:213 start_codon:yes stop_codon:yes gene_type:complete
MEEENENEVHFIGRTFYALYESELGTRHDRMMFVHQGLKKTGFFDWVQRGRIGIQKDKKTNVCVMDCKII